MTLYGRLDAVAQHFNSVLFEGTLPAVLFTLRGRSGSLGYFSPQRWEAPEGSRVGEIALNTSLFAEHSWLSLMKTIAEQQCHIWQHAHGGASRPGYRNAQWSAKAESIGLKASSTGKPGGRATGQRIFTYVLPGGKFINACAALADGPLRAPLSTRWERAPVSFEMPLPLELPGKTLELLTSPIGPHTEEEDIAQIEELKAQKRKLKYSCSSCGMAVWGRPGLGLLCQACGRALRAVEPALQIA